MLYLNNTNAYIAQGLFSNNTGGWVIYVKKADFAVAFYENTFIGNHETILIECLGQSVFEFLEPKVFVTICKKTIF